MLFFNSFIRYLIKSNLVLTHNTFIFLAFLMGFNTFTDAISSVINLLVLVVVIVWPILISWFLIKNKDNLDTEDFKTKYQSLYQGLKIERWYYLLYNSAFCIRRFLLALAYVCFAAFEYNLVYLVFLFQII